MGSHPYDQDSYYRKDSDDKDEVSDKFLNPDEALAKLKRKCIEKEKLPISAMPSVTEGSNINIAIKKRYKELEFMKKQLMEKYPKNMIEEKKKQKLLPKKAVAVVGVDEAGVRLTIILGGKNGNN